MKALKMITLFYNVCNRPVRSLLHVYCGGGAATYLKMLSLTGIMMAAFISNVRGQYQIEDLDRGIVAVKTSDTSVFISWRLLATDPDSLSFNVYRGDTKINDTLVVNSTNYIDSNGTSLDTYHVVPVLGGIEQAELGYRSALGYQLPQHPVAGPCRRHGAGWCILYIQCQRLQHR